MARTQDTEPVVHQLIHGYRQGHQLLVTSTQFDDDSLIRLANYSDSAPQMRPSEGPYLTGYSLPNGEYVLARTWPVLEAARPNTVITRSFVIPRQSASRVTATALSHLLTHPTEEHITEGLRPLPVKGIADLATRLDVHKAVKACQYYLNRHPLAVPFIGDREEIALAIWDQFWVPARQELWFCTVANTQRFSDRKRLLKFIDEPDGTSPPTELVGAMENVVEDLLLPGAFRAFVHFVGSGQRSTTIMPTFAEAYALLQDDSPSAVDELQRVLVSHGADVPDRLRRLKRRFLGFDHGEPRWNVPPLGLLTALADGPLGRSVFTADASLDKWISVWWDLDARQTASLIARTSPPLIDVPPERRTVAEDLGLAFRSNAHALVTPTTLAIAAQLDRDAARNALWQRNDPDLWAAWLGLPNRDWFLDYPTHNEIPLGPAVGVLVSDPLALRDFIRKHPPAVFDLAERLATNESLQTEVQLPKDAARLVRDRIEQGGPLFDQLLRVADPDVLPRAAPADALRAATANGQVSQAIVYLIARHGDSEALSIAADAYATLYEEFASGQVEDGWTRLSSQIRGDRNSWDRCGRLANDFAHVLQSRSEGAVRQVMQSVAERSPDAAISLIHYLDQDERKGLLGWLTRFL